MINTTSAELPLSGDEVAVVRRVLAVRTYASAALMDLMSDIYVLPSGAARLRALESLAACAEAIVEGGAVPRGRAGTLMEIL